MLENSQSFNGQTLLISGGTGTFGHAVLRRMLRTDIASVRIFSRDEKKQDDMRREFSDPRVKFVIGDVRDRQSIQSALRGVDLVFHAAALKQVPSCEFFPMEAVRTNTIGTDNMLLSALEEGVRRVVVLSTDKAAYPINAMGMSKALAEKMVAARAQEAAERGTVVCATRYGNVMASRGSVIPLFAELASRGLPLTITDPRMTRFMMSIDDAVDLVHFAFTNAEPGDLFVKKAPAATIEVLAQACSAVAGRDLPLKIIGTRHGEKLHETLLTREERARATDLGDYFRVPADTRGLDYNLFFNQGDRVEHELKEYDSGNARQLTVDEMGELLKSIGFNRAAFAGAGQ